VGGPDDLGVIKVGDRAGQFKRAVKCPCSEVDLAHGRLHQALRRNVDRAVLLVTGLYFPEVVILADKKGE
jgi:hypothetical protein